MGLLLQEGFDLYGYNGGNWIMDSRWTPSTSVSGTSYWYVLPGGGRRSGGCLVSHGNRTTFPASYNTWVELDMGSEPTTMTLGFALHLNGALGADVPYQAPLQFRNAAGTEQFRIDRTSDLGFEVTTPGGSVLASSSANALNSNIWQYVEIQFTCGSSGDIEIRVDGTEVLSATGINLQAAGSGGVQDILLRNWNGDGTRAYYDDLYICDDSGEAAYADFLGDVAVVGNLFASDGSEADFSSTQTDHYDAINDRGSGYSTHYIEGDADDEQDSFNVSPSAVHPHIKAVELVAYGINSGAGTATFKPYVKINGTVYYGDEVTASPGTTDKHAYTWTRNPATYGEWSLSVIQNAEWGYEVTGIS